MIAGAVLVAAIAGFAGPASAQLSPAWTACQNEGNGPPDIQIGACTELIQSGKQSNRNISIAYGHRGLAYAKKRQYDRAIQDYDQAIRLEPSHVANYTNRGIAYKNSGQLDRAIQDYDQAIRLNPNGTNAYYNRGVAYYKKGQYDRAIQDYDQAIRLAPNDADNFQSRSFAKKAKGDLAGAEADMAAARRLNPNIGR